MTIAVAPLTSSVLGSVEEQHVAMASGFNSAVARVGGLIATALLGAVLASEGAKLFAGFHVAMIVSAAVAALGSVVALTMLGDVKIKSYLSPRRLSCVGGDECLDAPGRSSRAICGR